jgi:hypothetical protein
VWPWAFGEICLGQFAFEDHPSLTATTYIQRPNTVGGIAPTTGCTQSTNVGNRVFVPRTIDYFFSKDQEGNK